MKNIQVILFSGSCCLVLSRDVKDCVQNLRYGTFDTKPSLSKKHGNNLPDFTFKSCTRKENKTPDINVVFLRYLSSLVNFKWNILKHKHWILYFGTVKNVLSDTLKYVINDKNHNATNVITDKRHNRQTS